jgi:hypothetical protein
LDGWGVFEGGEAVTGTEGGSDLAVLLSIKLDTETET